MEKATVSTFVVLGMHRSGTSALSRSINILGPRTSDALLQANSFNTSGYWEPRSVVKFNNDVLAQFNRHWADPKPLAVNWTASRAFAERAHEAHDLLGQEFSGFESIVFKDPRFSCLLPLWRDAITARSANPVYLISCRNPLEVAGSLAFRDDLSLEHVLELWLSYMLDAERNTRGQHRIVVHYEDLLSDWRGALEAVCQHASLPNLAELDADKAQAIDAFLAPEDRHHVLSKTDIDADDRVPDIVKRAYDLFLRFTEPQAQGAFEALEAEWIAYWQAKSPGDDGSAYIDEMPQAKVARSKELEAEGRIDEALALVKEAVVALDNRSEFHFRLGSLYEVSGDLESALTPLRRALAMDDQLLKHHMALARVLRKLGDREQEAVVLKGALPLHPDHGHLNHLYGACLEHAGQLDEAVVALRRALELDDQPVRFHLVLARVLRKQGARAQEVAALKAALAVHPDHPQLQIRLKECSE